MNMGKVGSLSHSVSGNPDHHSYFCWTEIIKPQRIGSTIWSVCSERRPAHLSLLSLCENNQLHRSFLCARCLRIKWFQFNSAHFTLTRLISTMRRTLMVNTDRERLDHANTEDCDRQNDTELSASSSSSCDDDLYAAVRKEIDIDRFTEMCRRKYSRITDTRFTRRMHDSHRA